MEIERFDDFARHMCDTGASRRQTLRELGAILLGSAFGGIAVRLSLADVAAAKGNRKPQQALRAAGQRQGQLPAEGRRKGKKKPPKKNPPKPLPPECRHCNDCQMCKDDACVRDPDLEGVLCLGSGANCGYCQGGFCAASDRKPCEDGLCPRKGRCCPEQHQCSDKSCVPGDQCCEDEHRCPGNGPCVKKDRCCPDEKRCVDPESPTGYSCVGLDWCCPNQKKCGSGCISKTECCPLDRPDCGACGEVYCDVRGFWHCDPKCCANEKTCPDGTCVAKTECCRGEKKCSNGSCISIHDCCPNQKQCPDTTCVAKDKCCLFEKKCPDGSCVDEDKCCPGQTSCDGKCCPAGFECCNGDCKRTADGPWAPCGDGGCISTQVYQCCGDKVCWATSDCCTDGRCCPYPHKCCGTTCCFGSG